MATPLLATYRILFTYYVDGLTHHYNAYVKGATLEGDDWMIDDRVGGAASLLWTDAVDGLAATIASAMSDTATCGTAQLLNLNAGQWEILDQYVPSFGSPTGGRVLAAQYSLTLRTTTYKIIRVIVLEGDFGVGRKLGAPTEGTADEQAFMKQYTSSHTVDDPPYNWQVGRDNNHIAVTGFVAMVNTLNRKLRRARGLA